MATAMDRGHAMRSEPLLPLSYQGALLTSCLKATPELFDAAVNKQVCSWDHLYQDKPSAKLEYPWW